MLLWLFCIGLHAKLNDFQSSFQCTLHSILHLICMWIPYTELIRIDLKHRNKKQQKCRRIGGRRFSHPRRQRNKTRANIWGMKTHLHFSAMFILSTFKPVSYVWSPSNSVRNRIAHSTNGNGASGKGKGSVGKKGRGKGNKSMETEVQDTTQNPFGNVASEHHHLSQMFGLVQQHENKQADRSYRERIKSALPAAAWYNNTPTLVDGDWDARVCTPAELNAAGGVSYIHKEQLPDVLRRVNFTTSPCAIVTSQHAKDLGLPYPSTAIRCTLRVKTDDGKTELVEVSKFLTQIGFGQPVEMRVQGPCVTAPRTMLKVVIRYDILAGFDFAEISNRTVANTLSKYVNEAFFLDITTRLDGTATAMVQDTVVHTLLEASGNDHIYFKLHSTEPKSEQYALHWLADSCTHEDAITLRDQSHAVGLAFKRSSQGPKFGLRFASESALEQFCQTHNLGDKFKWGRFKASNIPSSVGFAGLHAMLAPHKWEVQEVEYFGEDHAVFLASKKGSVMEMYWKDHRGRKMPVKIQALNAKGREMSAAASQSSRATSHLQNDARRQKQKESLPKRESNGNTGETPPPKQRKEAENGNS